MVSSIGSAGSSYSDYASKAISQANDMLTNALNQNMELSNKFVKFAVTTGSELPVGVKGGLLNVYA